MRPYVRYNEPTLIPKDEDLLRDNGSYPSGHSIRGWAMKSSWPTSLLPVPNIKQALVKLLALAILKRLLRVCLEYG